MAKDKDRPADRGKPPLLTAVDVARLLGVSVSTVRRLVTLKHLSPPRKIAGKIARWFPSDLRVYLYRLKRGDFE